MIARVEPRTHDELLRARVVPKPKHGVPRESVEPTAEVIGRHAGFGQRVEARIETAAWVKRFVLTWDNAVTRRRLLVNPMAIRTGAVLRRRQCQHDAVVIFVDRRHRPVRTPADHVHR